jgi:small subunit ribosomal protein S6
MVAALNFDPVVYIIPKVNNYLLTLVLKPELDEKERKTLLDSLTKKILGEDGKVTKEEMWGAKDLAYPIKRQTKGFIAHFEITADPKNAKTLDKELKLEEDILRYLLIRR